MTKLRKLLQFGVASIGVFSLLGYLGKLHWTLELANHFRVQYLWGGTVTLILLLLLKKWRWSLIAALFVGLNAFYVLPWYFPGPVKVGGHRIKLLQANVEYDNQQYDKLLTLVQEESPDIVTLQEVDKLWLEKVSVLASSFPYSKIEAQDTGGGLALYSKIKLESAERDELGLSWRPGIQASFKLGNKLVRLLTIHPPTPTEAINFPPRNQQLQAATERLQSWPAPKILIGDLNDTMWSSYHPPLLQQANLVNARRGHGIEPSWPAWLLFKPLMIPIDQCLVSPEIVVASLKTGKNIGSDHLPLIVELTIPQ